MILNEIARLKKIKKNKIEIFKNINNKNILDKKSSEKKNEDKINHIFNNSENIFDFINNLSLKYDITIQQIGREGTGKNDNKTFYYECLGNEIDIFKFINEIEKSKKFVSFNEKLTTLEIRGDMLQLKTYIMYMSNNKKEFLNFKQYRNFIFQNVENREIGKKRRKI